MEQLPLPDNVDKKKIVSFSLTRKILLGFIVFICLLFSLNYVNIIQLSKVAPVFSLFPNQTVHPTSIPSMNASVLTSCSNALQRYLQLTGTHFSSQGITGGTLHGILQSIKPEENSVTFQVRSVTDPKTYPFTIPKDGIRIYNQTTLKYYASLSEVPLHHTIELTYNCDPHNGNLFTIVHINMYD